MKDEFIISFIVIIAIVSLTALVYILSHPAKASKKELTLEYVVDTAGNCFVLEHNSSRFSWIPCGLTPNNINLTKE